MIFRGTHTISVAAFATLASLSFAVAQDEAPTGAGENSETSDGQLLYNNYCRTCHSTDEGDNRLAPNLHGIVGRKAGAAKGYGYSSAVGKLGITWDRANLDKFIADPDSVAPGNKMQPYGGVESAENRTAIIDFLENPSK